jgi:hypothetical protein
MHKRGNAALGPIYSGWPSTSIEINFFFFYIVGNITTSFVLVYVLYMVTTNSKIFLIL